MKSVIIGLLVVGLLGCTKRDRPTKSAEVVLYSNHQVGNAPRADPAPGYIELPTVPAGCVARVYHVEPNELSQAQRSKTDWADFLRAQGMTFPHGGFAVYSKQSSSLIVANTPEQLALLEPF